MHRYPKLPIMLIIRLMSRVIVTMAFCGFLWWIYVQVGPVRQIMPNATLIDAYKGAFRHGSQTHLALNLLLILVGGLLTEPRLGPLRTIGLAVVCIFAGATVQTLIVSPNMVGSSGVAYGFIAYGLLAAKHPVQQIITICGIGALLLMEHFLMQAIATYYHATSAFVGGAFAVLGPLIGSAGRR